MLSTLEQHNLSFRGIVQALTFSSYRLEAEAGRVAERLMHLWVERTWRPQLGGRKQRTGNRNTQHLGHFKALSRRFFSFDPHSLWKVLPRVPSEEWGVRGSWKVFDLPICLAEKQRDRDLPLQAASYGGEAWGRSQATIRLWKGLWRRVCTVTAVETITRRTPSPRI